MSQVIGIKSGSISVTYDKVSVAKAKKGKCLVCDKHMQIKKTFWQTISPFNKNKDGSLKTKEQILEEENKNAKKWLLEPLHHIKCK